MTDSAFAYPDDVASRWRPLSPAEEEVVWVLLHDASTLIRARFPGIDGQVNVGAVDRSVLTMIVAGMVKRALIAPSDGVSQQSEAVGPFSQTRTFANPLGNVFLTAADLTLLLGYQPTGGSHKFSNTTTHRENRGTLGVYGWPA